MAALLELGSPARARRRRSTTTAPHPAAAVVWACTSGSFVYGWDGAHEQVRALAAGRRAPRVQHLVRLRARRQGDSARRRVAVAATYPDDVAGRFADFLEAAGTEVVQERATRHHHRGRGRHLGPGRGPGAGPLAATTPTPRRCSCPTPPCTPPRRSTELEEELGKPVLTANQVTVWEGLRLVGRPLRRARPGHPVPKERHIGMLADIEPVNRESTASIIAASSETRS